MNRDRSHVDFIWINKMEKAILPAMMFIHEMSQKMNKKHKNDDISLFFDEKNVMAFVQVIHDES